MMSKLTFSDGMSFDTSGPLRCIRKSDGWYVIGNGFLIPVADLEEGRKEIALLEAKKEENA